MTVVYRYFDAEGALLYVGIAEDWESRLKHHQRTAEWFRRAASLSVEYHRTRASAAAAELEAIRSEWPIYNVAASPWKTGEYLRLQQWQRTYDAIGKWKVFGNGRPVAGAALAAHEAKVWREIHEASEHRLRLILTRETRWAESAERRAAW